MAAGDALLSGAARTRHISYAVTGPKLKSRFQAPRAKDGQSAVGLHHGVHRCHLPTLRYMRRIIRLRVDPFDRLWPIHVIVWPSPETIRPCLPKVPSIAWKVRAPSRRRWLLFRFRQVKYGDAHLAAGWNRLSKRMLDPSALSVASSSRPIRFPIQTDRRWKFVGISARQGCCFEITWGSNLPVS